MEDTLPPVARMDYDRILHYIGEFGYYQKRVCVLLAIITIPVGIQGTNVVFQTYKPSFRCAVPGLSNDTFKIQDEAHERMVKNYIPIDSDTGQFSQCRQYSLFPEDDELIPNQNKTSSCERWVYDVEEIGNSLAVELNLVCDREIYKTHINTMLMLGILVGSLVGGTLSDFFGRKTVVIVSVILQNIIGMILAFSWSIPVILAIRFGMAMAGVTMFLGIFVLLAEVVGSSRRNVATMSSMFGWSSGLFVVVFIQYFIRDWRTAQIVQTAPCFIFIVYWWAIQESPRWLMTRGKHQEAEGIIRYMAKVNKVQLPQEMEPVTSTSPMTDESVQSNTRSRDAKIWRMCSKPILAFRIAILCFSWAVISMVYFGLMLGVGDLIEGDLFVNFTLQSAMELISHLFCLYVLEKVGRKKIFCSSIITAGVSCLSISIMMITETNIRWMGAVFFSLGKFGITLSFSLIYIVTTELLPTIVRNSGMGFFSFVARIGGLISPFIASASLLMSGPIGKAFPVLLFGALSLTSGLLSLWLPETKGRKLPETIDDANNFKIKKPRKKPREKSVVL